MPACLLLLAAAPALALAQTPGPPGDTIEKVPEQVVAVLGLAAHGSDGKEVGRIVDVLVDTNGQPRAAVIDVGGFLGVGNRKVAVEWAALHFAMGKEAVATLGIRSDQIKSAPAYDPGKPVQAIGLPEPPSSAAPSANP
jgi:hypothetical protein